MDLGVPVENSRGILHQLSGVSRPVLMFRRSFARPDRIRLTRLKGSVSGACAVVPAAAEAVKAWIRKRVIKRDRCFRRGSEARSAALESLN
jgi:hypothetical protein